MKRPRVQAERGVYAASSLEGHSRRFAHVRRTPKRPEGRAPVVVPRCAIPLTLYFWRLN